MGLPTESPLSVVVDTGAGSGGAISRILKVGKVMKEKKTAWSSTEELPVRFYLLSLFFCLGRWMADEFDDFDTIGRNTPPFSQAISLDLHLSRIERTSDTDQSTHVATLWPRDCQRKFDEAL